MGRRCGSSNSSSSSKGWNGSRRIMHGDVFALFPLFLLHKRHVSRITHHASCITCTSKNREKNPSAAMWPVGFVTTNRSSAICGFRCRIWCLGCEVEGSGFYFWVED